MAYRPGIPTPPQERVPYFDVPYKNDDGRFITDFIDGQDMFAWVSQGPVAERHLEKLGELDVGITLYRRLLKEQMDRVRRGQDPMEVYRDPAENELIELFHETMREPGAYRKYKFTGGHMKYSASLGEVQELYRQAEALEDAGRAAPRLHAAAALGLGELGAAAAAGVVPLLRVRSLAVAGTTATQVRVAGLRRWVGDAVAREAVVLGGMPRPAPPPWIPAFAGSLRDGFVGEG